MLSVSRHVLAAGAFFAVAAAYAFPPAQAPRALDLNGEWRLQAATSADKPPQSGGWRTLRVPGQAPGDLSSVWLEREFRTPADWAGLRFLLRCELLEQPATVFRPESFSRRAMRLT